MLIDFLSICQSNMITKTCSVSAQPSLHRYITEKCVPSVTFFVITVISVPIKPLLMILYTQGVLYFKKKKTQIPNCLDFLDGQSHKFCLDLAFQ